MDVLGYLKRAVSTCADVIKWAANIQGDTRRSLVADLQAICSNCEDAYSAVLARLVPVKDSFTDSTKLAGELRAFAADVTVRNQFKPDHLCGSIDQLLQRLSSYLDPLKYAIDLRRIGELQQQFVSFGNYDVAIRNSYDEFTNQLDQIAGQIGDSTFDPHERAQYAQHAVEDFQNELRSALETVRQTKAEIVRLM